ncbi:MAG: alpha-amylase [Lachnospiraceae bacterium]|nr:alpha-amylase [Lachnospiraceae bacterium]
MRKDKVRGITEFFLPTLEKDVELVLYNKKNLTEEKRLPMSQVRGENLFYAELPEKEACKYAYHYQSGDKTFADIKAGAFIKDGSFGEMSKLSCKCAVLTAHDFDWGESVRPQLSYRDMIVYLAHVRGFTMHASSKVRGRGTFYGMMQKIPYLKELGITTVELQPIYEYDELDKKGKVNYWGYQQGYYYAPKAAYSYKADAVTECKEMIKAFHEQGMEIVLQFYFPNEISRMEILKILHYWSYYYQVDGFHLMGENIPVEELAKDIYLCSRKLWYYDFPVDMLYPGKNLPPKRVLASYQDGYMYDMRRLLKGDEGCIYNAVKRMTSNPAKKGTINFMSNYFGLTMWDNVSFDRKHNEDNGEKNKDGNDYNGSWNCGAEGVTKKKQILSLRKKQYKNAFALLMLSQGTPLFFMGDEFGNSQKGNNNPYCQDNEIAWLNWNDLNRNNELYQYVKDLIAFRNGNGVFHMKKECMLMDYLSCGYPDLSFHGEEAYRPSWEHYSRQAGLLFCGDYAGDKGTLTYLAINMHWEEQSFAYPKLKKGQGMQCIFATDEGCKVEKERLVLPPRTICVCTIKRTR